jgi:hypothetical protein
MSANSRRSRSRLVETRGNAITLFAPPAPQHFLCFFPLPHEQGSFLSIFATFHLASLPNLSPYFSPYFSLCFFIFLFRFGLRPENISPGNERKEEVQGALGPISSSDSAGPNSQPSSSSSSFEISTKFGAIVKFANKKKEVTLPRAINAPKIIADPRPNDGISQSTHNPSAIAHAPKQNAIKLTARKNITMALGVLTICLLFT